MARRERGRMPRRLLGLRPRVVRTGYWFSWVCWGLGSGGCGGPPSAPPRSWARGGASGSAATVAVEGIALNPGTLSATWREGWRADWRRFRAIVRTGSRGGRSDVGASGESVSVAGRFRWALRPVPSVRPRMALGGCGTGRRRRAATAPRSGPMRDRRGTQRPVRYRRPPPRWGSEREVPQGERHAGRRAPCMIVWVGRSFWRGVGRSSCSAFRYGRTARSGVAGVAAADRFDSISSRWPECGGRAMPDQSAISYGGRETGSRGVAPVARRGVVGAGLTRPRAVPEQEWAPLAGPIARRVASDRVGPAGRDGRGMAINRRPA